MQNPHGMTNLQPVLVEKEHVFDVYDSIATHWHHTRGIRKVHWATVKLFIEELPAGTLIADVGCGDGKYFGLNGNSFFIGCDTSFQLLKLSHPDVKQFGDMLQCDAVSIPHVSNLFDSCLCIAVLHHLATDNRRIAVISECIRITATGGRIMIQAWALEQGEESRIQDIVSSSSDSQDRMVPWHLHKRHNNLTITAQHAEESNDNQSIKLLRYCHFYQEGEIDGLIATINEQGRYRVVIEAVGLEKSNWFVILRKL